MKYYKMIFLDKNVKKKYRRILWRLEHNAGQISVFVISLSGGNDLFDIIHCANFKQREYPKDDLKIMGIASSYGSALEMVTEMVNYFGNEFGDFQFKNHFLSRENDFKKRMNNYKVMDKE